MSDPPSFATATLAQLYMQQGHLEQARRILARVLAADPFHEHAHALAARLAERSRARLYAAFQRSSVVVRWHDAPAGPDLHLILVIFRPLPRHPDRTCVHVTSVRCLTAAGEHTFAFSGLGPRASASLCLARLRLPAAGRRHNPSGATPPPVSSAPSDRSGVAPPLISSAPADPSGAAPSPAGAAPLTASTPEPASPSGVAHPSADAPTRTASTPAGSPGAPSLPRDADPASSTLSGPPPADAAAAPVFQIVAVHEAISYPPEP